MNKEVRFLLLCGLPASGKSTFAKELIEREDGTKRDDVKYLSSDAIREELYGDESIQTDPSKVFELMRTRTLDALKAGKHVIYDATNISRKRRKGLLQQLPKGIHKTAVYMATNYSTCVDLNIHRDRTVPLEAVDRMYKNLQIPIYSEGWDNIVINYDEGAIENEYPKQFSDAVRVAVLLNKEGYELMNFLASHFEEFFAIHDLPQDSKYHSLSASRHTYYVYKHVLDNYETDDTKEKELMLWTALLHDTGKAFCKSFVNRKGEATRYANFIGHESVSSQLAINFLKRMGFTDGFIHDVAVLILFHMYLLDKNANKEKLKKQVGEDMFKKLEFLRNADTLAH
ncbi:AAA family ATPase [Bacillus stercoris]|uniref:AAA family ATPase n=1 Tax=Bacillus stercoris TaxID=2054641 RepID=UPI003CEACC99